MASTDFAVAGGIGAGLSSFADSYLRAKQMQQTNDLNQQYVNIAKQRENAGMLSQGMESDESGNVKFNPMYQQMNELQGKNRLSSLQDTDKSYEPGSAASHPTGIFYKQVMNAFKPGMGDELIHENTKLSDIQQFEVPVNHMFQGMEVEKQQEAHWRALQEINKLNNETKQNISQDKFDLMKQQTQEKFDQSEKMNQLRFDQQKELLKQKTEGASEKSDAAKEEKYQTFFTANAQKINPQNSSLRTVVGNTAQQINRIDRINVLLDKGMNLSAIPTEELAIALQNILGSGTGNGAQVEKLLPRSAVGDWQKIKSYFDNNPEQLNQPKFVQQMADILKREHVTTKRQLKEWQYPQLYSIEARVKKHDEETGEDKWTELLKMNQVDPVDYARFRISGQIEAPQDQKPASKKTSGLINTGHKIGDTTTDSSGVVWKKIKSGSDKDKSNWERQGGGFLDKAGSALKGLLGGK